MGDVIWIFLAQDHVHWRDIMLAVSVRSGFSARC